MGVSPGPAPARAGRIGVFGGSFDPPHKAHLALAQAAITALALDELHVIPTGQAWHKARTLSPASDRLAMTRLAFEGMPKVTVDARELQRPGPTFTIDTLEALQTENPGSQLYLIMGGDQFAAFRQWHRWQAIVELAIICIAERVTFTGQQALFEAYSGLENRFLTISMPLMRVSATQIRQLAASSASLTDEPNAPVPEAVGRYIERNRLYRSS
jgi:nicotinate-nucleotide adenylyltransferase